MRSTICRPIAWPRQLTRKSTQAALKPLSEAPEVLFRQAKTPMPVLNFNKYPWLTDLSSASARDAISAAQRSIATNGVAFFPEFVTTSALEECVTEAKSQTHGLHDIDDSHSLYYLPEDPAYPADHVRNRQVRTRVSIIPYDRLSREGALSRIYQSSGLKQLVGEVLNKKELHRSCDPFGRLSINVLSDTWSDEWHFDESDFSTTLMLQRPETGGKFEVTSAIRQSKDDFAFDKVEGAISRGENVTACDAQPGTLAIFCGSRCLHRVTAISGSKKRYVAVFTFSSKKGFVNNPDVQEFFFNRVNQVPVHLD